MNTTPATTLRTLASNNPIAVEKPGSINPNPASAPPMRPREHAEVHAQFVRLGTWQHLIQRERSIEVLARNTVVLITRMPASARNAAHHAPFCTKRTARHKSTWLARAATGHP